MKMIWLVEAFYIFDSHTVSYVAVSIFMLPTAKLSCVLSAVCFRSNLFYLLSHPCCLVSELATGSCTSCLNCTVVCIISSNLKLPIQCNLSNCNLSALLTSNHQVKWNSESQTQSLLTGALLQILVFQLSLILSSYWPGKHYQPSHWLNNYSDLI